MAYATRWSISTVNPETDAPIDVYIQERDYSGSITQLDPGGDLVSIRYTPIGMFSGTPHWTMAASEAFIEFVDDGTGQLIDVLSGDDEQFQVVVTDDDITQWVGFVVPDSYGFSPYQRGIARLTATDRLGTLASAAYLQASGFVYSGRASVTTVIANCLSPIASARKFSTHMQWYPFIGTDDLDSTDNPLDHLFINQDTFYDDDGNPVSCGYVLEQVCGRFQLQLFQAAGKWYFIQRRRSIASGSFTVFNYTAAGAADSPSTSSLTATLSIDGTTNRLGQPYATGTVPYGSVSTTYFHGNPFTDIFQNRSFEEVLHATIGGTPLANSATAQTGTSLIVDGLPNNLGIPAGMRFTVAGGEGEYEIAEAATTNGSGQVTFTLTFGLPAAGIADNAALTFLEDVGNWEYDSASGFPGSSPTASDGSISLSLDVDFETTPFSYASNQYVRQRSREQVAGGSGFRIQGGWDVNVPELDAVTTEVYMAFRMWIDVGGTPYYYKWSDSTWTTTLTTNEVPLAAFNLGNNRWDTFTFTTGELDDGGTPLTGYMYFEFREGHEFNGGGSSTTGLAILVDNFQQPVLIDANFRPAGDATQTTITYDGNVNRSKPEPTQFIFGDGPTTAHVKRLTLTDATGAAVEDITGDWVFGPATYASGYTLDQFWSDELLKQYRRSARVMTTGVHSLATTPYRPYQTLTIANTNNTTAPAYWWQSLEYRPASPWNIASGQWVEYVGGDPGDLLCEYSVTGSSVAALSLTLEQGIPCASGGVPIEPPDVFETMYVALQNNAVGATDNYVAKVTRDENNVGSWSYELLNISQATYGTGFTESGTLWVDEADDIMFLRFSTNNVWAFRLDGTPIVHVWTPDGTNDVVGAAIDTLNNRFYLMMRNDTGGVGRTSVLREYSYDGTYVGAAWSNLWGTFTSTIHLAYEDGYVYFLRAQGTTRILYRIDVEAGTHQELGGSHTTGDANAGYGAVDVAGGKYFANYIGSNEIRSLDLPTPGSVSIVEATTAANDSGIAVDRLSQRFYWTDAQRSITRSAYDGSGDENVIEFPATGAGTYIYGISLGR